MNEEQMETLRHTVAVSRAIHGNAMNAYNACIIATKRAKAVIDMTGEVLYDAEAALSSAIKAKKEAYT